MAEVRRFEDLICWQKARQLCGAVYELTRHDKFSRDFKLRGQIQAAAGSAMHNIAEGRDAGTDLEFIRFLKMARRSCSEVQSQLYLALDLKYVSEAELGSTRALADEVKKLVNGLIAFLRKGDTSAPSGRRLREVPAAYLTRSDESTRFQLERE
jgi:four helix bundle protein